MNDTLKDIERAIGELWEAMPTRTERKGRGLLPGFLCCLCGGVSLFRWAEIPPRPQTGLVVHPVGICGLPAPSAPVLLVEYTAGCFALRQQRRNGLPRRPLWEDAT